MEIDGDSAMWRAWKGHKQLRRQRFGVPCPKCPKNRNPTILMPGQKCKVDGYKDPRPRLTQEQEDAIWKECGFTRVKRGR